MWLYAKEPSRRPFPDFLPRGVHGHAGVVGVLCLASWSGERLAGRKELSAQVLAELQASLISQLARLSQS
jgi:hypothetical protein